MSLEGYAGMSEEASRILLEQIMQPGTSSEMVLEHVCAYLFASLIDAPTRELLYWFLAQWYSPDEFVRAGEPGDIILFDNRRMLHSTLPWIDVPHVLHQVFLRTSSPMLPCTLIAKEAKL